MGQGRADGWRRLRQTMGEHQKLPPQSRPDYTPTRPPIRQACAEIQNGWDKPTERSRRTGSAERTFYELPEVPAKALFGTADRGE